VRVREVGAELTEVVPVGAQVVVNDVETHGEALRVRSIDKPLQGGRSAVRIVHGIQGDAVVAPTAIAGERRDRHEFDHLDTTSGQILESLCGDRVKSPGGGEGADVKLVGDGAARIPPGPRAVGPGEL